MQPLDRHTSPQQQPARQVWKLALLAAATATLFACGGGGGDASTASPAATTPGTATASSFAAGPITGFGSVIINGIRFDDTVAKVADDDGAVHDKGDLKLGMVAEVNGGAIVSDDKGQHGLASTIGFRSELVGPVTSVDPTARSLVVLGQPVDVTTATVFDDRLANGFASITASAVVEVYATLDTTTGHYSATRIEPKTNALAYKVRGPVAGLDTAAHTFTIGGQGISYAGIAADKLPASLANGTIVRARLQTAQVAGKWVATDLKAGVRHVEDHDLAEVKGRVTAFTSPASFSVDGIAVDASKATFPQGTTGLALGARVEVEGPAVAGVIVATKVGVETEDEARHGSFELHGAIVGIDLSAKTLTLRGLVVSFANTTVTFKDGALADLLVGKQIEVKGTLSANGTIVVATSIDFEH